MARDVVCGMEVVEAKAPAVSEYKGKNLLLLLRRLQTGL